MKLRIIGLLAFVLLSACGKTEAQRQKDEVDTYMAGLLKGNGEHPIGMKLFAPAQIPTLLSYANDKREINPPANPVSSYLSVSSLGMYALWLVEGIRVAESDGGTEAYPATQRKAADAYRAWWNSGEFSNIKDKNPLDGSGLSW